MFSTLREAVEELDVPVDGDALRELFRLRDQLDARAAVALGQFDSKQLWELDHDVSLRRWLEHQARLTPGDAGRWTRIAKRVERYGDLGAAWVHGRLSGGQVDAITAVLTPRRMPVFDDMEREVLEQVVGLDVRLTATVMARWAERADVLLDDEEHEEPDDVLHVSRTLGDRGVVSGEFGTEGVELLERSLGLAAPVDAEDDSPMQPARRRALALLDVLRFYLDHHGHTGAPRQRPHMLLVWDQDRFDAGLGATTATGDPLDRVTSERLLCDCSLARLVRSRRGQILDYGTTVRNPPRPLRDALIVRDQGCRWPGCGRPARHCDAHHVVWFTRGGRTAVDNLALLCIRHHHKLHAPGWEATLDPETAELTITTPQGSRLTSRPPPPPLAAST